MPKIDNVKATPKIRYTTHRGKQEECMKNPTPQKGASLDQKIAYLAALAEACKSGFRFNGEIYALVSDINEYMGR